MAEERRSLTLVRYGAENVNYDYFGAYRMRIEASDAVGSDLDPYIFIYKRGVLNPYTSNTCDEFQAVCGPADLAEIPVGAPDSERSWPFYRLSYFEADYRNQTVAMQVWDIIKEETHVLVEAMGGLSKLRAHESYRIVASGDPPDENVSEFDSVSYEEPT